jgi:hypothetical protein
LWPQPRVLVALSLQHNNHTCRRSSSPRHYHLSRLTKSLL